MNIFKNKKGMGLPMVLGITVFVIGLSATLMSYIIFQARLVEFDINESEEYHNAVSNVNFALDYLSENPDLSGTTLDDFANYLNLTIENENGLFIITSMIDETNQVVSYLSVSSTQTDIDDIIFDFDGTEESFDLSEIITSETLLSDYLPDYIIDSMGLTDVPEDMTSYDDIMDYMGTLADDGYIDEVTTTELASMNTAIVTEDTYVNADLDLNKNQDLIVSNDSILFIDGDLSLERDALVSGNIVVNGDMNIDENDIELIATLYIQGNLTISNNLDLGTADRPTFIFVSGTVEIKNIINGYAYIIADRIILGNNVNITGGVYAHTELIYGNNVYINENPDLDLSTLYGFAVPTQITTASDDPDGSTDSDPIYTYPKLN